MLVYVLELVNPRAEGRLRVFAHREHAERVARRWTGCKQPDESGWDWKGVGAKDNYDAWLYDIEVEE
mgnify:CR=1 FL=1